MFVAFSSEGAAAQIATAIVDAVVNHGSPDNTTRTLRLVSISAGSAALRYLCAGAGTAGAAQSTPPAHATYSYVVFQASGLLALANITSYDGATRGATLSPPPPYSLSGSSRYVVIPPSAVMHAGLLSFASPAYSGAQYEHTSITADDEDDAARGGGGGGALHRGRRYVLVLQAGGSETASEYLGTTLFVFLANGRVSAGRILNYNASTRRAEVFLAGVSSLVPLAAFIVAYRPIYPEGVRMWIDGLLIINAWVHATAEAAAADSVMLDAASPANVFLEYRQMGGEAVARLEWKARSATQGLWQVIPSSNLFFDVSTTSHPVSIL